MSPLSSLGAESRKDSSSRERKGGLSCAECRRSKLKCDRVFPCQSCIRRGCAAICPEGTLAATKGNKVLAAHAQKLTDKVKDMSLKIQQLESALAEANGQSPPVHATLAPPAADALTQAHKDELEEGWDEEGELDTMAKAIGSLSIGSNGQAKYHGETAGSEYFQDLLPPEGNQAWYIPDSSSFGLPDEIVTLLNAFPLGLRTCPFRSDIFLPFIPTYEKAQDYTALYYEYASFMYDPIVEGDFRSNILSVIYNSDGQVSLDHLHSHKLSVFFILMANGVMYETGNPISASLANQYHAMSRAALALDSILLESTCATVQSLLMMYRYMLACDRTSHEARWLLTGLCARVAQSIGLQRDSANWKLDEEEVQRRRNLFWEVYTYDSWMSLINGRPPALMIQHTDARFPDDLQSVTTSDGKKELGYHAWKFRYSGFCLSAVVNHIFQIKSHPYSTLLELDKKIRTFPIPSHLRSPGTEGDNSRIWSQVPAKALQQYCVVCERELNFMYIHRSYYAQALREMPEDPLRHKYSQSVLAVFRSACSLIRSLKGVYYMYPDLVSKPWFFWSGTYSSCIVLGALVVESPGCALTHEAYQELQGALPFFEEGSTPCRPPDTLIMLQKLRQRAFEAFTAYKSGFRASPHPDDVPDELAILRGQRSVITSRSPTESPRALSPTPPVMPRSSLDHDMGEAHNGRNELLQRPDEWYTGQHPNTQPAKPTVAYELNIAADTHNHIPDMLTRQKSNDQRIQPPPMGDFAQFHSGGFSGFGGSQRDLTPGSSAHSSISLGSGSQHSEALLTQFMPPHPQMNAPMELLMSPHEKDHMREDPFPINFDAMFPPTQSYTQPAHLSSLGYVNLRHPHPNLPNQTWYGPNDTNQDEIWSSFLSSYGLPVRADFSTAV